MKPEFDGAFDGNPPFVMVAGNNTLLVAVHCDTLASYVRGPVLCDEYLSPKWGSRSIQLQKNPLNFSVICYDKTNFGKYMPYRFRICNLSCKDRIQKEIYGPMKPEFEKTFDSNSPFVTIIGHNTILVGVHVDTLLAHSGGQKKLCRELISPTWGWESIEAKTDPLDFAVLYDPDEQKDIFGRHLRYRFRVRSITEKEKIQKEIAQLTEPHLQDAFEQGDPIVTVQGTNTILVGVHVDKLLAHSGGQEKLCHELMSPTWGWNSVKAKTDPLEFGVFHHLEERKDIFGQHLKYRFRIWHTTDKEKLQKEIAQLTKPHFQEINEMKNHNFYELIDTDKRAMILIGPENSIVLIRNDVLVGSTGDHYVMGHTISPSWGEDVIEYNKNPLKFVITEADFSTTLSEFRAKISSNFHLKKVKDQIDALLSENMQTHYWD